MVLLDTMVLSELRKRSRNPGLISWIASLPTNDLFVSVVSIGEIQRGIEMKRNQDPAFARSLADWLDRVLMSYQERSLPIDLSTVRRWGRLGAALGHRGADLMVAATALQRALTVATRNLRGTNWKRLARSRSYTIAAVSEP